MLTVSEATKPYRDAGCRDVVCQVRTLSWCEISVSCFPKGNAIAHECRTQFGTKYRIIKNGKRFHLRATGYRLSEQYYDTFDGAEEAANNHFSDLIKSAIT